MGTQDANIEHPLRDWIQDLIESTALRDKVNHFKLSTVGQIEKFLQPIVGMSARDIARILSETEWFIATRPDQIDCGIALLMEHQDGFLLETKGKGEVWFPLRVASHKKRHPFALLIAACDKKEVPRKVTASLMIRVCDRFASRSERKEWGDYCIGWALERLAKHDEAVESYNRAIHRHPHSIDPLIYKAYCLGVLGRHEDAIETCEKALSMDSKSLRAYFYKGFSLCEIGIHKEAIACFDRILQVDKSDELVWYNRGRSLGLLGRHEDAVQSYSEALKLNEKDKSAWYNKGMELQDLDRYSEALICFQKAASLGHEKAQRVLLSV